jgi:hypoxanthine phosphoribosyltransferase
MLADHRSDHIPAPTLKRVPPEQTTFLHGTGIPTSEAGGITLPPGTHVAFSAEEVSAAITKTACFIDSRLKELMSITGQAVVPLVVMNGGRSFADELLTRVQGFAPPQFVRASSYTSQVPGQEGRQVQLSGVDELRIPGAAILLDDILDGGLTVQTLSAAIRRAHSPAALDVAVLIHRLVPSQLAMPDFAAITTDSHEWFVGMGLDLNGHLRDLKYVLGMPPGSC